MKAIKYIGQIVGSFIYANIYTLILYFVTVIPVAFILTLDTWQIIVLIILIGGFLEFLQHIAMALSAIPFAWIVKNNITALICAIGLIVFNIGRIIYNVWQMSIGNGSMAIFIAIIVSLLLLKYLFFSVISFLHLYSLRD